MKSVSGFFAFFAAIIVTALPAQLVHAEINRPETGNYHPVHYFNAQMQKVYAMAEKRQDINFKEPLKLAPQANRNAWLKAVYDAGVVEASEFTRLLTDKLVMSKVLEKYMGKEGFFYHPKSMGVKYFLAKHDLVDDQGNLTASQAEVLAALAAEFPHGSIVKRAVGMNSAGKKHFYFRMEDFVSDLFDPEAGIYASAMFHAPYRPEMIGGRPASGELLMIQENVVQAAGIKKPLKTKEFVEVRLHTYEDRVVKDITFNRWKEHDSFVKEEVRDKAEIFVGNMLSALGKKITAQQAWSIDVAALDNGVMRLIEVNVNRGQIKQWSGMTSRPAVLGAYTRHLEKYHNIRFAGLAGWLFRNNLANYRAFIKKRYITGTAD